MVKNYDLDFSLFSKIVRKEVRVARSIMMCFSQYPSKQ